MSAVEIALEVVETEIEGLRSLASNLDDRFEAAVKRISESSGRTIICGMGKSGIIGKKIAASLASTGTPSFFMHPGEAFHGDLGMVLPEDVFIAISNSGETDEVLKLLPFLRDNGNYVVAMTGKPGSTLAQASSCHLNVSVPQEACPLQLAPTASTTAALVMGDALTVALMQTRRFQPEDFARFHPGGSLGRRLLSRVRDEMTSDNLPLVSLATAVSDAIHVISAGRLGLALVMDGGALKGIITDGDLRRAIEDHQAGVFGLQAGDIMSAAPASISADASMQNALDTMQARQIGALVVMHDDGVVGVLKK